MSLNCLRDTIGISGCGSTTPPSGILINSMAGITLDSIEKLSKQEANTFILLWNEIQGRCERKMQSLVQSQFNNRYKINNIVDSEDFGRDVDTTQVIAQSAQYRGWIADDQYFLPNRNIQVKRSALQTYWIQTLTFYSTAIHAGCTIKIFDIALSTVIDTITFNAVVGWNTIAVNKYYDAWSIFVGIDATALSTVYKYVPSTTQMPPVNIRGASMTIGADTSTIAWGTNSFGLGGVFGVRCKFDNVVCNNLDQFYLPYSYLLASELMFERIASDRINKYTVDKEQAVELKAHYDTEFEKALSLACDFIELDLSDRCLKCDAPLMIKESNFFVKRQPSYENIFN